MPVVGCIESQFDVVEIHQRVNFPHFGMPDQVALYIDVIEYPLDIAKPVHLVISNCKTQ